MLEKVNNYEPLLGGTDTLHSEETGTKFDDLDENQQIND